MHFICTVYCTLCTVYYILCYVPGLLPLFTANCVLSSCTVYSVYWIKCAVTVYLYCVLVRHTVHHFQWNSSKVIMTSQFQLCFCTNKPGRNTTNRTFMEHSTFLLRYKIHLWFKCQYKQTNTNKVDVETTGGVHQGSIGRRRSGNSSLSLHFFKSLITSVVRLSQICVKKCLFFFKFSSKS